MFIRGTEPTSYCEVHVEADVHAPSGKLANEQTPPHEIETRIFTQREVPYYPEEHNGIVPGDWEYELPRAEYDPYEDSTDGIIYDPDTDGDPDGSSGDDDSTNGEGTTGNGDSPALSTRTLRTPALDAEGSVELSLYRIDDGQRVLLEVRTHNVEQDGDKADFRITGSGTQRYEIEVNGSVAYTTTVDF